MQIQRCVQPKGSPGYDRWAAVFNLKLLAHTFNFLQENNLLEYEKLEEKAQQAKDDFNAISARIKVIDVRLPENASLQKHIGTYSKTKDIYAEYRKSNWNKKFYSENKEKIELHKDAKKFFDLLGLAKLPTIKTLQAEYATLQAEKKSLWAKYKPARDYMQNVLAIKQNAEQLLSYSATDKLKENERT
jgi:ribosomal protein RSM22 (predicted rRNA methylase)